MGADIYSFVEVKKGGKWLMIEEPIFEYWDGKKINEPFWRRDYNVFGFLAGVRNPFYCQQIHPLKGLPDDSEWINSKLIKQRFEKDKNYHSHSWLTLKELLKFNYNKSIGRIKNEMGGKLTYREHLGDGFFKDLEVLKTLGNPEDVRVVFWFDS